MSIGVVVLHHDRSIVEQVAEALEAEADLFVAATSLEAATRARVVIAGGELLERFERGRAPLIALAEREPIRAARAALAAGARDIVCWPEEASRLATATRSAATSPAAADGGSASVIAVRGVRGGIGTSTIVAMIAASLPDALVVDLDGGQRTFTDLEPQRMSPSIEPDAEMIRALAVPHTGGSRALHIGEQIGPTAARGLFRAARQVAAAVIVDGARAHVPDVDRSVLVAGCDVASVRRAKELVTDDTLLVLRRTRYSLGKRDVVAALGRRVDLLVPDDPAVVRAADLGRLPSAANRTMRAVARFARTLEVRR